MCVCVCVWGSSEESHTTPRHSSTVVVVGAVDGVVDVGVVVDVDELLGGTGSWG